MGQKVHPYGFRIGYNRTWHSRWYAEKDYLKHLHDDLKLRAELKKELMNAAVSEIEIERGNKLKINIMTARPGVIIGKKGASVDLLRDRLQKRLGKDIHVNIVEIQRPETDAQLVAESIAMQIERRVAFRRAMKKGMESAFRFGAQGIKIRCSGRLNGAEIARSEWYQEGRLPLHTLKADIDYGFAEAHTTYGKIGVKCWIYKGDLHRAKSRRKAA
jgi:small subunit ribosomal protein S3